MVLVVRRLLIPLNRARASRAMPPLGDLPRSHPVRLMAVWTRKVARPRMRSPHRGVIPTVECSHVFILFLIGRFIAANNHIINLTDGNYKKQAKLFLSDIIQRLKELFAAGRLSGHFLLRP